MGVNLYALNRFVDGIWFHLQTYSAIMIKFCYGANSVLLITLINKWTEIFQTAATVHRNAPE
jgi:hypothetical protein